VCLQHLHASHGAFALKLKLCAGESQWNKENKFTGWVDVPLAESGMEEAHRAAKNLKEEVIE